MSRKLALVSILATLIIMLTLSVLFNFKPDTQCVEEWVPYVPDADIVSLEYWEKNGTSYMKVSIEFRSSGYNVSDWGTPVLVQPAILSINEIFADAEIWDWTGGDYSALTWKYHTYDLGSLAIEEYTFIFKAWGTPIKDTTFIVPEFPSFLILPLFMISTLPAAILYRREHSVSRES